MADKIMITKTVEVKPDGRKLIYYSFACHNQVREIKIESEPKASGTNLKNEQNASQGGNRGQR